MNNFFDVNSIFYRTLYKVYQIVVLNVLFILASIPLVTIGATTTALYVVSFKIHSGTLEGGLPRAFFRAFKANFRKATLIWAGVMTVLALILFAWPLLAAAIHAFAPLFYVFILIVTVLMLSLTYIFPLLARFENSIKQTIKNAYIMSLANIAYSIIALVINFVVMVVVPIYLSQLLFLWIFTAFAFAAFANSFILNHVFQKYIEKEEKEEKK